MQYIIPPEVLRLAGAPDALVQEAARWFARLGRQDEVSVAEGEAISEGPSVRPPVPQDAPASAPAGPSIPAGRWKTPEELEAEVAARHPSLPARSRSFGPPS